MGEKLDTFGQAMQYFKALDGLRLLASLNIVLLHMHSSWCLGTAHTWPIFGSIIKGPAFNASIFFVLGGYIYFHQLSKATKPFSLRRFLTSRFSRLYPMHVLSLVLMVFAVYLRGEYSGNFTYLLESMATHLSLTWVFDPLHYHSLNEPSWALTPFFLAYASLGLLLGPLRSETRKSILVLVLVLTLIPSLVQAYVFGQWGSAPGLWRLLHTNAFVRVFEFYFGMVLARLFQVCQTNKSSPTPSWMIDVGLIIGFVAAWALTLLHSGHGYFWSWMGHQPMAILLYGAIIWALSLHRGWISKLFSARLVSAVGRASFYPYLLHLPLMTWTILGAQALGFPYFFHIWWQPLVFLLLLYGLSALHIHGKKKV